MEGLGWIMTLVIGGIAGWIASLFVGTSESQGIILNVVVGIIGAFIGSFVFGLLGITAEGNILGNLITATVGAVILLSILRLFTK